MSELTQAVAAAPDHVTVEIDGKTETFTAPSTGRTADEKTAIAEGIWTAWRNKNFVGLDTGIFNRLNAAGDELVAAIAAQL